MYIAIEGIDTVGKSTQIALLQKEFLDGLFIKEPGLTKMGSKLRAIIFNDKISAKSELFLFLADRTETIEKVVKPNLDKLIISDRSLISGIAYGLHSFEFDKLLELNQFATNGIYPDKIIILKISENELNNRLSQKTHDNIEKRGLEYLMKIQNNLIEVSKRLGIKTVIIDATESIETIFAKIKKEI